jgi:peptide/nickel transport system substrate-binding protein
MTDRKEHPYLPTLRQQLVDGTCDRREFLRTATLLGLSASAAYAFVGKVTGESWVRPAKAEMPKGGVLKIGQRILDLSSPHTYSWFEETITRQVCEYLTKTGHDNVTRPYLAESWEVSDDLRTWTIYLRKDVTWHSGRPFVADDAIWNLKHALDPDTGSSMVGLMQGYMLTEVGDVMELWDANAIEKVDDHTFRLNAKEPQLAVPEHLFHYPMLIIDPEEGGTFGAGSNGTGAFEMTEYKVGEIAVLKARKDYWGEGPYVDELRFIDLGDDPAAQISALASKQIHGLYEIRIGSLSTAKALPHVNVYEAATAQTAVARTRVTEAPFGDARVRKALRLATDSQAVLDIVMHGNGLPGEHHHVSPIHPEYAELAPMTRDVAASKALLAEAGFPDGIDLEIAANADETWEVDAVQTMVEQWREAGIRCKINVMPGSAFWDVWDKVPFGMTNWTHRPLGVMVLALAYRTGVPWNESAYSNPEFDRLLTKAEGLLDVDKRREVIAEIEKLMQEDGPIIQPIWRSVFTAYDKRVKGFRMHPTSYIFANELAIEA